MVLKSKKEREECVVEIETWRRSERERERKRNEREKEALHRNSWVQNGIIFLQKKNISFKYRF
jgi:hypothetical protein